MHSLDHPAEAAEPVVAFDAPPGNARRDAAPPQMQPAGACLVCCVDRTTDPKLP